LVFFKNEEELFKFYQSKIIEDIREKVSYLTEEASTEEVDSAVKKATL
jgi:hypothetical protein